MEKALELLRISFLDIKEIAAKVGYNDSTHFMREFKKAYGSTPSQYRRRILATDSAKMNCPLEQGELASKQDIALVRSYCILTGFVRYFAKRFVRVSHCLVTMAIRRIYGTYEDVS